MIRKAPTTLVALAVLSLAAAATGQAALWRFDCGGSGGAAPFGPPFVPDAPFVPGGAGYLGTHTSVIANFNSDDGPSNDLFAHEHGTVRTNWTGWRFTVPNGSYVLRLHFSEVDEQVHGPGQRVMDLSVEGQPLVTALDLAAQLGIRYAGELVVPVSVSDGTLDVAGTASVGLTLLNAVEVWKTPAVAPVPGPVTGLLVKDGYGRNILAWNPVTDPFVTGFVVERAPAPGGPWTPVATTWTAPPRFHDSSAPLGVPQWYRVHALGLHGTAGPTSAALPATAQPQSATNLRDFELTVAPADLLFLDSHILTEPDTEVPGVFTADGRSWDVQVRYRGDGTLLLSKKSWKVKFPGDDPFEGRHELNLKSHFLDTTLEREPLCSTLFADLRHPVSAQQRVHLVVNGEHRGVFNDFEQVDEDYLASRGRDPQGELWKADASNANLAPLATPADYALNYPKKTGAGGDEALIDFIQRLNDPALTPLQLADLIDVDDYLDYLAVVGWTGCADQVFHNYYLLRDPSLNRFEWITWDNDRSLFSATVPIDTGTSTCTSCGGINVLKDRVLAVPGFRWRYAEKLRALMQGAAAPATFAADVAARHALIHDDALADVAKQGWELDDDFLAGPALLNGLVAPRDAFIESALASYEPPSPPTPLWINELLAFSGTDLAGGGAGTGGGGVGAGALLDEAGDADDWVELYNASGQPLDASGLFLTNELADPTRWPLPPGSVIPPRGRLLLWCDGETSEGPLHAPFTLGAAGGELGLVAADGETLLDVYDWRPQQPGVAEGRVPDGGAVWRALPEPTPGAENTAAGNLPPVLTWFVTQPAVPGPGDAIQVFVQAKDADAPLAVTLHWRAAGGPFATLALEPVGNDRWSATLPGQPSGTHVELWFEATDAQLTASRLPAAAPVELLDFTVTGAPGGGLRISEFMADNASTIVDEHGDHDDWIELYNPSSQLVDLSGWHLTDDLSQPFKSTLPAGVSIAPHASLLLWADDEAGEGPLHVSFKLSKSGEAVGLFDPQGVFVDGRSFGPQQTDVSQGLLPDALDVPGDSAVVSFLDPSPGAANVPPPGGARRYDAVSPALTAVSLAAVSPPKLGGSLGFVLTSSAPGAAGLLFPSLMPLHVSLGADGVLLVSPLLAAALNFSTDGAGAAAPAFKLPGKASLLGLSVEWQAYVLGAGTSNAVIVTLGP